MFAETPCVVADASDLVDQVRSQRVGGTYWGAQPDLPKDHVLVRSSAALPACAELFEEESIVLWADVAQPFRRGVGTVISGECDPWHVLASASAVVIEAGDELHLIAALLGVRCYLFDETRQQLDICCAEPAELLGSALSGKAFENPFTAELMSARQTIDLCGFWRRLIDSNRDIQGGVGFAFWKQDHIAPLLWGGSSPFKFLRNGRDILRGSSVAVWRAKAPPEMIADLKRVPIPMIEVEDGFLRSRGLGADCIPPLSITVDRAGAHFDPSRPSELEEMLQDGNFDDEILARARDLRRLIVNSGLGKYESGVTLVDRPAGERRHVLVPGQVEDDRAVQCGGCGLVSNLELLKRVRDQAPDAYILYKPHPDVLAGHRRGFIPERLCLQYADEVVGDAAMASLIAMVDEVHVNTSLAGFEALLRSKPVTTYGVPFYSGWGLTRDLGPVPSRRTARRTLDELVAATLLLYPRYLDPVTGLPCPAEIVVARLSGEAVHDSSIVVGVRRLQGKLMRCLRSLVQ